jgi:hypothetical protein
MAADTTQQLTQDGQEVQQLDFNNVAAEAAHSDDYVFGELLRLAPYNGSSSAKAIIPFGPYWNGAAGNNGVVQGTTGGVTVMPFRVVVGSRVAVSAYSPASNAPPLVTGQNNPNAVLNFRGVRSGLYVPTDNNTTLGHFVSLAANSSGNPRIDLIYAQMTVDASGGTISRMVRPPVVNSSPAPSNIATTLVQAITMNVAQGTPGATPALPSLPADTPGSGIYNIPLAYVMVANGFTSSTNLAGLVQIIAPCVPSDGRVTGALRVRPATCISTDTTQVNLPAWAAGSRPPQMLPSSMVGGESVTVAVTITSSTNIPADAAIVDNSIDWRGRHFLWFAQVGTANGEFAYTPGYLSPTGPNGNVANGFVPSNSSGAVSGLLTIYAGFGQSFGVDDTAGNKGIGVGSTRNGATVMTVDQYRGITSPQVFGLYVDMTTGYLKAYSTLTYAGQGVRSIFIWVFASAQVDNDLF